MNTEIDSIIFDLDGTLWDTCPSCAVGWNNVLEQTGIEFREVTANDVRSVAGLPHRECIEKVFKGLAKDEIETLVSETAVEDNRIVKELGGRLYDGVKDGILSLSKKYSLFIVSNCQKGYIETFLEWSNLDDCFRDFECWGNTQESKSLNTRSVIQRNQLGSPIFVGDTMGDCKAATDNGLPFVFVSYGFGNVPDVKTYSSFPVFVKDLI